MRAMQDPQPRGNYVLNRSPRLLMEDNNQMDEAAFRESTAEILARLTESMWIDGSYLGGKNLKVHFTEHGQKQLKEIGRIMSEIGWP